MADNLTVIFNSLSKGRYSDWKNAGHTHTHTAVGTLLLCCASAGVASLPHYLIVLWL